jgi:DNA-binding HxlR family transcriptional regulator
VALGKSYVRQDCSLARALEVVGERWTLLLVRDCFYGVRRFGDLQAHLDIPRAVLTERLNAMVAAGLLVRRPSGGRHEYVLADPALALWPAVFALAQWGEQYWSPAGPRRIFSHAACGTDVGPRGLCPFCHDVPEPADLLVRPGPGADPTARADPVSIALRRPHQLLTPLLYVPQSARAASSGEPDDRPGRTAHHRHAEP